MIRTGIIKASTSTSHPFQAKLRLESPHRYTYMIENFTDIPYDMRQEAECGQDVPAVFDFDPEDQFATFIPDRRISIKV